MRPQLFFRGNNKYGCSFRGFLAKYRVGWDGLYSRHLRYEQLEDRRVLAAGVLQETGDFVAEIQRWKDLALGRDSYGYVEPSAAEQADFEVLASSLLAGDVVVAATQAAALDYELVAFADDVSGMTLYELREQLADGAPTRGWGTYFVNLGFRVDRLVEVPHPLFDTNSWDVGAQAFRQAGARGFLIAGAHRHANGTGTADVAHLENSIFQTVHAAWNGSTGQTTAWQVHGFGLDGHDAFPAGTDAVISNGDGGVSAELVDLDDRLESRGFLTYSYNTLPVGEPLSIQVNDGLDGTAFSSLAASTNAQGIHSRTVGGRFVHAELEQSIRFSLANRELAASALGQSMAMPATFYVTAASPGATQLTLRFSQPVDAVTLQPGDLLVNGTSAIGATLVDASTAVFDLPRLTPGSYTATIMAGVIEDQAQTGLNEFHFLLEVAPAGTKFFVVDTSADGTFEYDTLGNLQDSYSLGAGNNAPRGAASDVQGRTVWVIDDNDYVYVYDDAGNQLGRWNAKGLSLPEGIATDGQHVWVVDRGTDRVYLFAGAAASRGGRIGATSSFALATGNTNPRGLTTDGTHLWVVNWGTGNNEVFKYTVDGTLLGSWTIDSRNESPRGITIDPLRPRDLWIVDNSTDAVYQYLGAGDRTSGSQTADTVFQLVAAADNPQGIADPPTTESLATHGFNLRPLVDQNALVIGFPASLHSPALNLPDTQAATPGQPVVSRSRVATRHRQATRLEFVRPRLGDTSGEPHGTTFNREAVDELFGATETVCDGLPQPDLAAVMPQRTVSV